jgi:hypothetical protein
MRIRSEVNCPVSVSCPEFSFIYLRKMLPRYPKLSLGRDEGIDLKLRSPFPSLLNAVLTYYS